MLTKVNLRIVSAQVHYFSKRWFQPAYHQVHCPIWQSFHFTFTALQSTLVTFVFPFFVFKFVFSAFRITNQLLKFSSHQLQFLLFFLCFFFVISSSLTSLCLQLKSFWSGEKGQSGVVGILLSRGRTKVSLPHKYLFLDPIFWFRLLNFLRLFHIAVHTLSCKLHF